MIAVCPTRDHNVGLALLNGDRLVQRYRAFFSYLDWRVIPERAATRPWPGPLPHPMHASVKALLIKLCEHKAYVTHLRLFLVEHPLLVLEIGFRPVLDAAQPYGFDVERTVPCDRWLRHWQQHLDNALLQALLRPTVRALQAEIPGLGQTAAYDVKHIYAWVQENNRKAYVPARYDPERQPTGDPDCRLGVKTSSNQVRADGTTKETKEYVWGYGSGVAAATDPRYGDIVLTEYTQPFNAVDSTYYHPLYARTVATLGSAPTNVTADAAFDAWHIYQTCAIHGGVAAIPLNTRGHPPPQRRSDGTPLCPKGLAMSPSYLFAHTDGYRAQEFRCPLLHPQPTLQTCDHDQFAKGPGCVKHINVEAGGLMRTLLDRDSAAYKDLYRQRTAAERINAQATAWGIERPKVRNGASVRNLNTLTYIVINVQALQRARALNAPAASSRPMLC
jgi:Transposase DDE domain